MGKHCVVQMTVTTVSWSYVSRMFPECLPLMVKSTFLILKKKGVGFWPTPWLDQKITQFD